MEEKNGSSCPLCRTRWEDIPIPNLRRFIAALLVIIVLSVLRFWKKMVDNSTAIKEYDYAIFMILALVFLSALFILIYEASVYLKREPWFVFLDGRDSVHLHSKDPRECSEWVELSIASGSGVATPIIRFVVMSPDRGCILVHDNESESWLEQTAWKKIEFTRDRVLLAHDNNRNVISGLGYGPKDPAHSLPYFIKRYKTLKGLRIKNDLNAYKLRQFEGRAAQSKNSNVTSIKKRKRRMI